MSNKELYLFTQLPLWSKFRFERPDQGPVLVKTSATHALHEETGKYQPVSATVLVFPIYPFSLLDQADHEAHMVSGGADLGDYVNEGEEW